MQNIWDGILIGGAGGTIAGLTIWIVQQIQEIVRRKRDSRKIHTWLRAHTTSTEGERYRSTRAIASWTNLTMERVRDVCSTDSRMFLSTGPEDDRWGLYEHVARSQA